MAKEKEVIQQEPIDYAEQKVTIMLPRATGNEANFELVSVNGKTWKIMKGVSVQIPGYVYDVIAESLRQEKRLNAFNAANAGKV